MKKLKSNLHISVFLALTITFLEILVWLAFYYVSEYADSIPDLTYNLWLIVNIINIVPSAIASLFKTYIISERQLIFYSVYFVAAFLQNLAIIYIIVFNSRRNHNNHRGRV